MADEEAAVVIASPISDMASTSASSSRSSPSQPSSIVIPSTPSTSSTTDSFSSGPSSVSAFPHAGLLPKQETQCASFLASKPSFDGRGTLIAIFDTGTDIHAPGLLTTTEGKPKIVEAADCSGSGDVDVSTVVKASEGGELQLLSGRRISGLTAAGGEYHIGLKRAYELFPEPLVHRLKKSRKQKWDDAQRQLETALHRQIQAAEDGSKERTDQELRYNEVRQMAKGYEDHGPVLDVVMFEEESGEWAAVIVDEDEAGRVKQSKTLHNFALRQEYDTFSGDDLMNYSVSLEPSSHTCTIVTQAGAHGTHVAGIVAAHFPDQPELNGQAPGAQLVSVKIGDSRLGSMETGVGLMRGLMLSLRLRVDLVNMSYGEPAAACDTGRYPETVREMINKYGIMFVCSAGNDGPALSSSGSPGSTTQDVIGVGAWVSPAMLLSSYSMRRAMQATQYTWSSRGPAFDGSLGVCISAPGGAMTSVPTWTLQGMQLMHGTSMSSPNACGLFSVLLSACKQQSISYTPHRIRKAIENTARVQPLLDPLTQGAGLVQIADAFDYLQRHRDCSDLDVAYRVNVGGGRGVYLREPEQTNKSQEAAVTIEPQFFELEDVAKVDEPAAEEEEDIANMEQLDKMKELKKEEDADHTNPHAETVSTAASSSYQLNQSKVAFQLGVALVNPVPSWIECPSHLMLVHGGRSFTITIHPQRLPPGLHHAQLLGLDSRAPERGPLFRVPVTVLVAEKPQTSDGGMEQFELGGKEKAGADGGSTMEDSHGEAILVPSRPTPIASFSATPRHSSQAHSLLQSTPSPSSVIAGIDYSFHSLHFHQGTIHRKFVHIPASSTWADFRLRGHGLDTSRQFMFHCMFLLPDVAHRDHAINKYFSITNEEEVRFAMDVVGGRTMELCLAQYWSCDGDTVMDMDVAFHAIKCEQGEAEVVWDGSEVVHRLDLSTPLRTEYVSPSVSLKAIQQPVRPSAFLLSALSPADSLPRSKQIYQLVLTYHWECRDDSTKVVFRLPPLQGVLYESQFESQFFMLFDANKRLIGSGDAWPKPVDVKRGKYTVRVQVRHEETALLERLKEMVALFETTLSKPIELPIHVTFNAAVAGGQKWSDKRVMKRGQRKPLWVGSPDSKQLPAWIRGGEMLKGEMALSKAEGGASAGAGKNGKLRVRVVVPLPVGKEGVKADSRTKGGKKDEPQKPTERKKKEQELRAADGKVDDSDKNDNDSDVKKQMEVVRPIATEAQKAERQAVPQDNIKVTIDQFQRADSEEAATDGKEVEDGGGEKKREGVTADKEIEEEVRDVQIDYLSGLKGKKKQVAFQQLYPSLVAQWPHHLPLLVLRAETLFDAFSASSAGKASTASKSGTSPTDASLSAASPTANLSSSSAAALPAATLQSVLEACDAVLAELDQHDIAAHFGRQPPEKEDSEGQVARKQYEKKRDALLSALHTKLLALKQAEQQHAQLYAQVYNEMSSWVDMQGKDSRRRYGAVSSAMYAGKARWGAALKQLNGKIDEAAVGEVDKGVYDERVSVLRRLVDGEGGEALVAHWLRYERLWQLLRFPLDYTRF